MNGNATQRWWEPERHRFCHACFREKVKTLLLCARAQETARTLGMVPAGVLLEIVEKMGEPNFQQVVSVGRDERAMPHAWNFDEQGTTLTWPMRISWPAQVLHDVHRTQTQAQPPLEVAANTLYFKPHDERRTFTSVLT